MKKLLLGIILGGVLFFFVGQWAKNILPWKASLIKEESSNVLLEKIETVCKMITVEGHFSEVYDHKDYYWYDISPFRKKALLKVKAKVSVGYDLKKAHFEIKPLQKKLIISRLPDPEILSIDTDLSYYDLSEGSFNQFKAEELTELNRRAKQLIEEKAKSSDLMEIAVRQGNDIFELIELIAKESDFTVEYKTMPFEEELLPKDTFPD